MPAAKGRANSIRGAFLRFLLLGGDDANPVHEMGVQLEGALIEGEVNLDYCIVKAPIRLRNCRFDTQVTARRATIPRLLMQEVWIPGFAADGLITGDSVTFGKGFHCQGQVRLTGARIGGQLSLTGATIDNGLTGCALHADRIVVERSLSLSEGFSATGGVRLLGARIKGNLGCNGGSFEVSNGDAICLDGAVVEDGLFLRDIAKLKGGVNLTTAYSATLVDDAAVWEMAEYVQLDGYQYDRIIGPCGYPARIAWLRKQLPDYLGDQFKPQPWEQLARIMREMGHSEAARAISIEKQWARLKAGDVGQRPIKGVGRVRALYHRVLNFLSTIQHRLFGGLAGFGYRPLWTVGWMLIAWALCATAYQFGAAKGVFGPTDAVLQTAARLEYCGAPGDPPPSRTASAPATPVAVGRAVEPWISCAEMPAAYTTFQPWIYSLDLLLPLTALQQDEDWSPMVSTRGGRQILWWGVALRWVMWFEILFGWIGSLLLVAAMSRLVDKE